MSTQQIGAGLSATGMKALGYTSAITMMAGAVGVLGGAVGAVFGGDAKSAGIGGIIGALIGSALGGVMTYEASQGVTQ